MRKKAGEAEEVTELVVVKARQDGWEASAALVVAAVF